MSLSPGTRLGPYEILSLIGAGGMGQVYKARDTRLDRIVALKLLPSEFAERPDRRRRFDVEARAISSLSHPHICALFDVGEDEGRAFIVMEYLEGETLDDRLTRGALPAADVLRYGAAIADALDHAHRAQIVHRDLKPSNVMLTRSGPKLLDFGLAKRSEMEPPSLVTTAPFDQKKLTADGVVIGTFQYMAPEQLEGRPADTRTDIFAFGVLLYEVATARKAFKGDSQASLIVSIMSSQPPPISAARESSEPLPPVLDHIVERCLAKDPADRWQTARDVKLELDWAANARPEIAATATPRARRLRATAWVLAAALVIGAAGALYFRAPEPPREVTRFGVELPQGTTVGRIRDGTRLAVSPDGRQLAIVGTTAGRDRIWLVQTRDSLNPRVLEGTDGAMSPFWSPDNRFIGFFVPSEGALKKVEVSGGPPRLLCKTVMSGTPTWSGDSILYSEFRKGVFRVSAEGGTPVQVTQVDQKLGELNHFYPSVLPDGNTFLYMTTRLGAGGRRDTPIVYAARLDSPDRKEVTRVHSRMVYSKSGHVLYVQDGALLAQSFDTRALSLIGEPRRIGDGLDYYRSTGAAAFSVSDADVLVHYGSSAANNLVWFDRSGKTAGTLAAEQQFGIPRISPDGERVAVEVVEPRSGTSDLWVYHVTRGSATRLTTDLNDESDPTWSADGRRIIFGSDRGTGLDASMDFFAKATDGLADEELLFALIGFQRPEDWSRDGQALVYMEDNRETLFDLWILPLVQPLKPLPFARTRFDEWGGKFSPDSKWVAFVTDETGVFQVYVAAVDRSGSKTLVSTNGGMSPRWRQDGKELFYIAPDGKSVMSVPVALTPTFKAGQPERLFGIDAGIGFRGRARYFAYDVSPNGQRFLISVAADETPSSHVSVVLNWAETLKR